MMPSRSVKDMVIWWTPKDGAPRYRVRSAEDCDIRGQMTITPLGHETNHQCTSGAAWVWVRDAPFKERKSWLAAEIVTILVNGDVDPPVLHQALLPLLEYRDLLPLDAIGDRYWLQHEVDRRELRGE